MYLLPPVEEPLKIVLSGDREKCWEVIQNLDKSDNKYDFGGMAMQRGENRTLVYLNQKNVIFWYAAHWYSCERLKRVYSSAEGHIIIGDSPLERGRFVKSKMRLLKFSEYNQEVQGYVEKLVSELGTDYMKLSLDTE